MGKKGSIYLMIALFTMAILMLFQYSKPKEVNWFPSYVAQHKIPFGTYVLQDVMKNLFPNQTQQIAIPPFEFLSKNKEAKGTYLFIDNYLEFGETELNRLLDWTSEGNTLYIASRDFEDKLLDTLHLNSASLYSNLKNIRSHRHQLVHPKLKTENGYIFQKEDYVTYFMEYGTLKMTVIGTVVNVNEENTKQDEFYNVIKTTFGKGEIILSTFPKAFTNYFILEANNKDYTAGLLSYIDGSKPIYMDNHYKSGKSFYTSPMYIFLNTKEFKWAYYITLIGAMLYVVFEGKRKQRAIPVVLPLKNQTLAFTRTIADMYFEKEEQKSITDHKIDYFLEYIRSHFYMGTIKQDDEFFRNLAARTNHSFDEIKELFSFMEKLKIRSVITNSDLKKLNILIEKFKLKADGK